MLVLWFIFLGSDNVVTIIPPAFQIQKSFSFSLYVFKKNPFLEFGGLEKIVKVYMYTHVITFA